MMFTLSAGNNCIMFKLIPILVKKTTHNYLWTSIKLTAII